MEGPYCMRKVLDKLTAEHGTADIIITNGYHMTGKVLACDSESILVEADGVKKLVFLHAVSTIVPRGTKDTET